MDDIADSVKSVTALMQDITVAGTEQSQGVVRIGTPIRKIDEATRQSVSLVGQSADDAALLDEETRCLLDSVAVFSLACDPSRPVRGAASHDTRRQSP